MAVDENAQIVPWKPSNQIAEYKLPNQIVEYKPPDIVIDIEDDIIDVDYIEMAEADKKTEEKKKDPKTILKENTGKMIKSSLDDAAGSISPIFKSIAGLSEGMTGTAKLAFDMGSAFLDVGAVVLGSADDMRGAMNGFMIQTGKSSEEMDRYQGVLEDIYANNYGQSFDEIANAMAQVTTNMGDMDDVSLQSITESAFTLKDVSNGALEIKDTTKAAKVMMDQFGTSGEEAMNLLAAGYEGNLNSSGKLLESISKYSESFSGIGLDADDMFNIFQKGADSGAWSVESISQAMGEFSSRVLEGSEETRKSFETIGLNADEMTEKFAAGGESAKEAFEETMEALAGMEDPMEQNAAGMELFGSMWEELGPEAVAQLTEIQDGVYGTADAMGQMKEMNSDDLGSMFGELQRSVELLMIPLGEALLPLMMELVESVLPLVQEVLAPLITIFGELLEPIFALAGEALKPLIDTFIVLIDTALKPLMELLESFLMPLFEFVFDVIMAIVKEDLEVITAALKELGEFIVNVFTLNWQGAWENIKNIFSMIFSDNMLSLADHVKGIFNGLIDFIKNVFTGNWQGAWENIKNIFSNIVGAFADIFKTPINAIVDGWNSLSSKFGSIKIPDGIPLVGGKSFSLPTLSRLRVGMDYVPSDDFPALLHRGEAVLTAEENKKLHQLGGLAGIEKMLAATELNVSGMPAMEAALHAVDVNISSKAGPPVRIEVPVNIEGREAARAIAWWMGEQLSWEEM